MAKNFRISSRRKGNSIHLRLSGDFDGMSAMELIYAIKDHTGSAETIYVETDGLCALLPFGRDVFQKHLCFSPHKSQKLVFTGNPGRHIVPAGMRCIERRRN